MRLDLLPGTRSLRVEIVADGRERLGSFLVPLPAVIVQKMVAGYFYPGHTFGDEHVEPAGHFEWQSVQAEVAADYAEHVEAQTNPEGTE